LWNEERQSLLRVMLDTTPDRLGWSSVNWTVPLLKGHLEHETGQRFSEVTIRRQLRRDGYVWKRYRYELNPDPEMEKKTPDSERSSADESGNSDFSRG
jgi:transposase